MEPCLRASEYIRATDARIRRWHLKVWLAAVVFVVLPFPALLFPFDGRISLVALGIATCAFGVLARGHLRVIRSGLLPHFRNPGTLVCDDVGFRLIDVSPALQISWTDIASARLLLSSTDAVAPGFVETIELTCVDGIVKIAWNANGRDQWLERLGKHAPIATATIRAGAWDWWQ